MKVKYALAALVAALVLAGCEQFRQARRLTPEQWAQWEAAQNRLPERRAIFVTVGQADMTDLDRRIAELADAVAALEDNPVANRELDAVRELRSRLDSLFEDLSTASAESWDDTKRAFDSALTDLQQACQLVKAIYDN